MAKRVFEIELEWNEKQGSMQLDADGVLACLQTDLYISPKIEIRVADITNESEGEE